LRRPAPAGPAAVRLQKVLAQAGIASRRASERIIAAGRVTVNGTVVTEMGAQVEPGREIPPEWIRDALASGCK